MISLTYVSSKSPTFFDPEVSAILKSARRFNTANDVTGLLLYDGRRFLQVIEGEPEKVDAAYARLAIDTRHRALVVLSRREITGRQFGGWALAFRDSREPNDPMKILSAADVSTQALFESFAKIRRAA